jgi:hypothetical protein
MSYSFLTFLVSFVLLTDPGINEAKATANTAKPAVKKSCASKPGVKKTAIQKLPVFDNSPLTQSLFFN